MTGDITAARFGLRLRAPILALLVVLVGIEIVLTGADLGLWGARNWRSLCFVLFAFRPGLLDAGIQIWPGQWLTMFVSHIFVHVGLLHMLGNLLSLGLLLWLLRSLPPSRFLGIGLLSALGGAAVFALMAAPQASMTGASGAISGLAAFWAVRRLRGHRIQARTLAAAAALLAGLVALEQIPGLATAWQTHLGGAMTGALLACRPSCPFLRSVS